ncbi:MAG: endo-1,4-beta-xylanase [Salinivirgaceae bacterium]|nr:endo-1,4-beta-xylanase [Salinivirgaceae bacterium]
MRIKTTLLLLCVASAMSSQAQLNKNPNKFLGNITTRGQIQPNVGSYKYEEMWDQLTPENETKWESIERSEGVFDFTTAKKEFQFCKEHGFKFKFHALLWGSQYPSYLNNLDAEQTLVAITRWFDAVAKEMPDLEYIDVANEAVGNHSNYGATRIKQALGGGGKTGYDWLAKAFIMARERWPNAVLIYNDYNTFAYEGQDDAYIELINGIKEAGGPIDAAGCQSHDLNDMTGEKFAKALKKIHDGVNLPIFISEYDIDKANDQDQLTRYKEQFPIMWEADYVAGVTIWGYIHGATWVDNSGIIKNGVERPAYKWLKEYMLSDAALNAKSPLINVASDYAFVSPMANVILIGDKTTVKGKASSADGIAEIRLYKGFNGDTALYAKYDTSAFEFEWSPIEAGDFTFKMQVLSSVSSTLFERSCTIKACEPAKPFKGTPIALPGKLEAEDYDEGENTIAYSDNDVINNGYSEHNVIYRDTVGVDVDKNDGDGWVVGWTNAGEWMQYTVKVEEEQYMLFTARVSSGTNGSAFSISMGETDLTGRINVPQTANNDWGKYTELKGRTKVAMPAGTYPICIKIEGSSCNIDYVVFETAAGDEVFTEPYNGTPAVIPGTIEFEEYDKVKKNCVAQTYSDNDSNNEGDAKFRTSDGVDIYKGNGGKVLGMTIQNEWLIYTVNIEKTQKYYWTAVVSSGNSGSAFHLYLDDKDITGKISVPSTGSWDTYKVIKGETNIELPEGTHTLKLVIDGSYCNLDKVVFSNEPLVDQGGLIIAIDTSVGDDEADSGVFDVYSVTGVFRGTVEIINNDTSVLNGRFEKGIYILRNKANGTAKRVMVY